MDSQQQTKITDIINNVFSLLGIPVDQFELDFNKDSLVVQINLPAEESGVFIGHQGETLSSLQLILSLIISQRLNQWYRIKVNVGDYQQRREQQLIVKADQSAQRAIETGQEIIIPGLNSYERHLIHDHLSHNSQVATESRGEEPNRQLFVSPKNS